MSRIFLAGLVASGVALLGALVVGLAFGFGVPVLADAIGIGYGKWQSVRVVATPTKTGFQIGATIAI